MQEQTEDRSYLFKLAQFLGVPSVFPPPVSDKLAVAVQFIIPRFRYGKKNKESIVQLGRKCESDVSAVNIRLVEETKTKQKATLVTVAFYLPLIENEAANPEGVQIWFKSRLLVERFLGLLSFFGGVKLSAVHIQPTILKNGQYVQVLRAAHRTHVPPITIQYPTTLVVLS